MIEGGSRGNPEASVADLLKNLNLTAEEVVVFSDKEDDDGVCVVEWAIVSKVLLLATLHATTIHRTMKSAWGNPYGMKIRSIGEKEENLFVVEFGSKQDMEWALGGSPWFVGKHTLILQIYDESIKPSDIRFDRMEIWTWILNLPLGWMNCHRGERVMGLIGEVKKMDVDSDGRASGPFLSSLCGHHVSKAVRRGFCWRQREMRNRSSLTCNMKNFLSIACHVVSWDTLIGSVISLSFITRLANYHMMLSSKP